MVARLYKSVYCNHHSPDSIVLQMEKDAPGAIKYIKQSVAHSKAAGFREGVREGGDALERLSLMKRS